MKALELLKSQSPLLLEDSIQGKKSKVMATTINQLMIDMNIQISTFEEFYNSQQSGDLANKIIIAKSLAEYFAGNKFLKVELAVDNLRNQEKAKINEYYSIKTKLLEAIRTAIKESAKEAFVSNYDIFEGDFVKCEPGHEIVILGDRNINVLETLLKELDEALTIEGNFDSIEPQPVDFSLSTLNRNIELCNRKANELFGAKVGKLNKLESFVTKLEEVGKQVVAFYTFKNALLEIGCTEKGVRDYEHDLTKSYIPLKKTLTKELKIELEDICAVTVNESEYPTYTIEENTLENNEQTTLENNFTTPTSFDDSFSNTSAFDNNSSYNNDFTNTFENNISQTPSIDNSLFTEPKETYSSEQNTNPFESLANTDDSISTSPFANTSFGSNNDNNQF